MRQPVGTPQRGEQHLKNIARHCSAVEPCQPPCAIVALAAAASRSHDSRLARRQSGRERTKGEARDIAAAAIDARVSFIEVASGLGVALHSPAVRVLSGKSATAVHQFTDTTYSVEGLPIDTSH
jgi:hypothetical protein